MHFFSSILNRMMISGANGTLSALLICHVTLCGLSHMVLLSQSIYQQFLAKEDLKNRCLKVLLSRVHNSHVYDSNCIFFSSQ
jgi:FlaA1/EpsC-like NDP-sugar epimerase